MSEMTQTDSATDTTPADDARPDVDATGTETAGNVETFSREYVAKLRDEAKQYRLQVDAHARRLFTELVKATDKLADARDMPYDAELLDDSEKLSEAIDALIAERPHLRARRITGDAGQGQRGGNTATPSFADLLRP